MRDTQTWLIEALDAFHVPLEMLGFHIQGEAQRLCDEANAIIKGVRMAGGKTSGLALVARYKGGVWGPRIVWVRAIGGGKGKPTRTSEVKMYNRDTVSRNTFYVFERDVQEQLVRIDKEAGSLRLTLKHIRRLLGRLKVHADKANAEALRQLQTTDRRRQYL